MDGTFSRWLVPALALFVSHAALAKPLFPNYEKLRKMPVSARIEYVKAARTLLAKISKDPRHVKLARMLLHELPLPLADFDRASQAFAEELPSWLESRCVFAGHVMTLLALPGSRYRCPKPPQGSCAEDEVECQPLLYGPGICVGRPWTTATDRCEEDSSRKYKLEEVVAKLQDQRVQESWNTLADNLTQYCDPDGNYMHEFQVGTCKVIWDRFGKMANVEITTLEAPTGPGDSANPGDSTAPAQPNAPAGAASNTTVSTNPVPVPLPPPGAPATGPAVAPGAPPWTTGNAPVAAAGTPANQPAAPGQPAAPAAARNCAPMFGMAIEGSSGQNAEVAFRNQVGQWADAYASIAENVTIVPTRGATQVKGHDSDAVAKLTAKLHNMKPEACDANFDEIKRYITGQDQTTKSFATTGDAVNNYHYHEIRGQTHRTTRTLENASRISLNEYNPAQSILNSSIPWVKKLQETSKSCGAENKSVVMISVHDHGLNRDSYCSISLGNDAAGNKVVITPELAYQNIIAPLQKLGTKVIFNTSASYSGCFVERIRKAAERPENKDVKGPAPCLMSQTRSTTPGYGEYPLIGGTIDSTYPYFFKELGNPLEAFICASAMDSLNEPQVAVAGTTKALNPSASDCTLDDTLLRINLANLAQSVERADLALLPDKCIEIRKKIPRPATQLTKDDVKGVFACLRKHQFLVNDPNVSGMSIFYDAIADSNSWPGMKAIENLIHSKTNRELFKECSINLAPQK